VFTGIVEEIGRVTSVKSNKLTISAREVLGEIKLGESIAVNGVCLTVTDFNDSSFSVEIMPETLKLTNLGLLNAGDEVNLERPLALGGRLGGHLVQGHVDDVGRIVSIHWEGEAMIVRFEASPEIMRYIVRKGFVAIDGISLTVVARDASSFQVSIVGFTREHTILGSRRVGDQVNLEVDIIAKYIEQLSQPNESGITADFLQEHGFFVR